MPPVVPGLSGTDSTTRRSYSHLWGKGGDRRVGHGVDLGSVSALSEIVSKSACSFACTSTTNRALASSNSNCFFSACNRAIWATAESFRGRPRGAVNPAKAPASRARRHSVMWLEYKLSRRSKAPFSPSSAAS